MTLKKGRLAALVLAGALVGAGAAGAATSSVRPPGGRPSSAWSLWSEVAEVWRVVWLAAGGGVPESTTAPAPSPLSGRLDEGCSVDPLGQCAK